MPQYAWGILGVCLNMLGVSLGYALGMLGHRELKLDGAIGDFAEPL